MDFFNSCSFKITSAPTTLKSLLVVDFCARGEQRVENFALKFSYKFNIQATGLPKVDWVEFISIILKIRIGFTEHYTPSVLKFCSVTFLTTSLSFIPTYEITDIVASWVCLDIDTGISNRNWTIRWQSVEKWAADFQFRTFASCLQLVKWAMH